MPHANSAEEHKLVSSFEAVRRALLQEKYADRLDKPLAYWALPNDRRLPLAFLSRSVGELLQTPFRELTATRGIGQKKIGSLVRLLHRATANDPPAVPYGIKELAEELEQAHPTAAPVGGVGVDNFDPSLVSEALWSQWCQTIRQHNMEDERLGRLAPSLLALPTVIWSTPLSAYMDRSLAEIRKLRTHGEKRVRVVLEVFHFVESVLSQAEHHGHLSLRLVPKFVPAVEHYLHNLLHSGAIPSRDDTLRELAIPMLEQIQVDAGEIIAGLTRERLGIGVESKSVRVQAQEMGVTRARVYQLLEECGRIMDVRWPEGRDQFAAVAADHEGQINSQPGLRLFYAIQQLYFPDKSVSSRRDPNENSDSDSEIESGTTQEMLHVYP